jgi:hypothetical protein
MNNMHSDTKRSEWGWGRVVQALGGLLALTCSVEAPLPLAVRVAAFGSTGAYLLFTALTGRWFIARRALRSIERER